MRLEILPVTGIGEVRPGADLAGMIADAAGWLRDGDVLVVTSKVVSKAEGRLIDVPEAGPARERVRAEALAAETARTVAARGATRIVATHHGFVMAAAGIDASNVARDRLALLPKDPDASARALRGALRDRLGVRVAVIISDTVGRPWRIGLTDMALGAAGIEPLRDHRGETDPYGNELRLTLVAVVDELAAAAELVKGKCDQVPVAVVRGYPLGSDEDGPGVVSSLIRDSADDLFSLGTAEARAAGLRAAATLTEAAEFGAGPVDRSAVDRAIALVAPMLAPGTTAVAVTADGAGAGPAAPLVLRCAAPDVPPGEPGEVAPGGPGDAFGAALRLGADVHRLRAALAAEGIASAQHPDRGPERGRSVLILLGPARPLP
jgi:coenzyme F420-0:L-glutamate ligase/coenzyme F420-1:gamma-L-glutamate ligase